MVKQDSLVPCKGKMASQGDDCYFYYYSTCAKGDTCPFRHQPAALGNEITCQLWLQGKCTRQVCKYRHMQLEKNRQAIQCYWESQTNGCLKAHCPFLHSKPRPFVNATAPALTLQSRPTQKDVVINHNPLLPSTIAAASLLNAPVVSQVFTTHAQIPAVVPAIPPFIDAALQHPITHPQVEVNNIPQKILPATGIADSSFQEHVRKFKEMFSGQQGSPKKDAKKKRSRRDVQQGDTSDLEFEQLMDEYEARQKKEKTSFRKDRRDKKDKAFSSKSNRSKVRDDVDWDEKQSKLDKDADERRKYREMKQRHKERKKLQKEKERRKKEKKSKREKAKDDTSVVSSDDFELIEDSADEANDATENPVENTNIPAEGQQKTEEKNGEAVQKDIADDEKKTEGEELGFHIKSYEEILREKALRKMLERRQQLQAKNDTSNESSSEKDTKNNANEDIKDASKEESETQIENAETKKEITVKSKIVQPPKNNSTDQKSRSDAGSLTATQTEENDEESDSDDRKNEIRSKVVLIGKDNSTAKPADESFKLKRAMKFRDGHESPKKVKVVRKVAVPAKAMKANEGNEPKKTAKDRKSLEIYKPPLKSGAQELSSTVSGKEVTESTAAMDNVVKVSRIPTSKDQDKSSNSQEAPKANDDVPESPLKVKTFEEIMEEKRARRQQNQGGNKQSNKLSMESTVHIPNAKGLGKPAKLARRVNVRTVQSEEKAERMAKAAAYRKNVESAAAVHESKDASSTSKNTSLLTQRLDNSSEKNSRVTSRIERNPGKPRLLKRRGSKDETRKEHSSKSSPKDKDTRNAKLRRLENNESNKKPHVKRIKPVNSARKSMGDKNGKNKIGISKVSINEEPLGDLADDIDLDIGVEVEDAPGKDLQVPEKEDKIKDEKSEADEKDAKDIVKEESQPAPMEDIQEAVNAELRKKDDLLSDDELERELESGDFALLESGEEIDDDDLLLELEEMINS